RGVEILASDVSRRVLAEAREGLYSEFALRNTPAYYRERYFRREGERFRLAPEIRALVEFRQINLAGPDPWAPPGRFHAVFCRNVLIYFDQAAKRRVVRRLVSALAPGGVLIVGRSETLLNVPDAPTAVRRNGTVVYQAIPGPPPGDTLFPWRSHD
ncbi:MAG: chemotaxis protein CheR, partial [Candidatus Dadabacteria bacterium]